MGLMAARRPLPKAGTKVVQEEFSNFLIYIQQTPRGYRIRVVTMLNENVNMDDI